MFEITFGVWKNGSGWQPHDIASRTAETMQEAVDVATKIVAICPEQVIATVINFETGETKEFGWE